MTTNKTTTAEKEAFIRANFKTMKNTEMAEVLHCSPSRVGAIAKSLGLSKQDFGDNFEEYILANFMTMRNEDIAAKFGCSPSHVSSVARRLGLSKSIMWDSKCDEFLIANHKAMTVKEMAAALGCSVNPVYSGLERLGLQATVKLGDHYWKDEHDVLVKEKYKTMTIEEIAKEMDFSPNTIKKSIAKQGLSRYVKWDETCDAYLIKHYGKMTYDEIGEHLNASPATVYRQAKRLKAEKRISVAA